MTAENAGLNEAILQFGKEIFAAIERHRPGRFSMERLSDALLGWGMQDEELKVALFRFVDVLPALESATSVMDHLHEYLDPVKDKLPGVLARAMRIGAGSMTARIAAPVIKSQIRTVAERFIVGETAEKALPALRKIRRNGMAFTVDLLGEAAVSEDEALEYHARYMTLLKELSRAVPQWSESAPLIPGHRGEETAVNISVKLSSLYSQVRPVAHRHCVDIFKERLGEIFSEAKRLGAAVYVDMEDSAMTSMTLETFCSLLDSAEFRDYPRFGIVLQAYLRRTESDLTALVSWVRRRGVPISVRLVKGAYWDTEKMYCIQRGWGVPVWLHKANTDYAYEKLTVQLLKNAEIILPAFASHNVRSLCHAIKAAEQLRVPITHFELQALFGMGEPIVRAFQEKGYLVRQYSPVGELITGMSYLVRRLLENTSNEGFLRLSMFEQRDAAALLQPPRPVPGDTGTEHLRGRDIRERFFNIPHTDYSLASEREGLQVAIDTLREQVKAQSITVQPIVAGRSRGSAATIKSTAAEDGALEIANVDMADRSLAEEAIEDVVAYQRTWAQTDIEKRAEVLFKTAALMERDRRELTALIVLEAGKQWTEADADVAEAIDFLTFYAHEARSLFRVRELGHLPGERNIYLHEPRGTTAVICPWNFPLAIPCGMFSAALVTGNTALLKPAEQTPAIAWRLFQLFLEAGLPVRAAAFLPGYGEEIGPLLVEHPRIATVVFTGSKAVGLHLLKEAASVSPRSHHVKRVIIEMGGKNAIIVDEDADLDEALKGIVYSAFGYQGQKCSACSRVIAVGTAYPRLLARLGPAVKSLLVGPPSAPESFVGPLIDKEAVERVESFVALGMKDCTFVCEGALPSGRRRAAYVPPTVFCDVPTRHRIIEQEIFGPVLAVLSAPTFHDALRLANESEYGLTGAVYSRSPKHIDLAMRDFEVGNLYINRGSTGALVMRQPFGGAKMSGVGSKAGGPDYLLQFVNPKAVSENMVRRGFAPEQ